jgi:hypothetical protein
MRNFTLYLSLLVGAFMVGVGIYLIVTRGGQSVIENSSFQLSGNLIGTLFVLYGAFRFFRAYATYKALQRDAAHQAMVDAKAAELDDKLSQK